MRLISTTYPPSSIHLGRSLSALMSTQIMENPDIPEAHRLRGWYDSTGKMNDSFKSFAAAGPGMGAPGGLGGGVGRPNEVKTFAQVEEENIGVGDKVRFRVEFLRGTE